MILDCGKREQGGLAFRYHLCLEGISGLLVLRHRRRGPLSLDRGGGRRLRHCDRGGTARSLDDGGR